MVSGTDGSLSTEELNELVMQSQKPDATENQENTSNNDNAKNNLPENDQQNINKNTGTDTYNSVDYLKSNEYLNDLTNTNLALLLDVSMHLTVEIGRGKMKIEDVLKLGAGAIVELDKLNGELVDIRVNNRLIGQGEVVAVGENFGIKIHNIIEIKKRFSF